MIGTYLGLIKVNRRYWVHSKGNARDSRLHLVLDLTACTILLAAVQCSRICLDVHNYYHHYISF